MFDIPDLAADCREEPGCQEAVDTRGQLQREEQAYACEADDQQARRPCL